MRKLISTTFVSLAVVASSFAQDAAMSSGGSSDAMMSKRGNVQITPEEGEWAIGINAVPFIDYAGALLSNGGAGSPTWGFANTPGFSFNTGFGFTPLMYTVFGKKMTAADQAYRVRFQLGAANSSATAFTLKDLATPDPLKPEYVEDKAALKSSAIVIGLGKEFRRGKHRLQGVYGAEGLLGFAGSSSKYTYANAYSATFPGPQTADFSTIAGGVYGNNIAGTGRVTSVKNGKAIAFGVRGFAGVEYFIAPKVSIGGEFGYTLGLMTQGKGTRIIEQLNNTGTASVTVESTTSAKTGFMGLGVDKASAALNMFFYF